METKKYSDEELIELQEKLENVLKDYPVKTGIGAVIACAIITCINLNVDKEKFMYILSSRWDALVKIREGDFE